MAANADFLITRAGLNAALQAEAQGAKIKITQFTIGSGFGYTPTDDMTEMQGDTLSTPPLRTPFRLVQRSIAF